MTCEVTSCIIYPVERPRPQGPGPTGRASKEEQAMTVKEKLKLMGEIKRRNDEHIRDWKGGK